MTNNAYPQASPSYKLALAKRRAYRLADRLGRLLRMMPVCGLRGVVQRWNAHLPHYAEPVKDEDPLWFYTLVGNRMQHACNVLLGYPEEKEYIVESPEICLDLAEWWQSVENSFPNLLCGEAMALALLADPKAAEIRP